MYMAFHYTLTRTLHSLTLSSMVEQAVEEIDYEALPTGAGYGINMLAGALVRALCACIHFSQFWHMTAQLPVFALLTPQAGISEHAVMFPVDSIKVSVSQGPSPATEQF
jgi:hypothetical protein